MVGGPQNEETPPLAESVMLYLVPGSVPAANGGTGWGAGGTRAVRQTGVGMPVLGNL